DWGGTTGLVDVSAKQKTNLNLLLEMVCQVADLQELKAVPDRPATGVVLEAKLDRGRGPVATLLVQNGTLHTSDNFVVGNVYGKIRAMFDDRGGQLEEAPPSTPVEILGIEGLPQAGDQFVAVADRDKARGISEYRERKAQELAEQEKVDIRLHSIIYELQDEIKRAMSGLLEPTFKENYQGRAEVLETFRIPKVGTVAGCRVGDGLIKRDSEVRLLRDNVVVFKGKVGSLRRFKEDAAEVRNGMECGIAIANYSDIKVGDVIEAFVTERIAAEVIA